MTLLKKEMLKFFKNLKSTGLAQTDMDAVITQLQRHDTTIPDTPEEMKKIADMIIFVFCRYPQLMTPGNLSVLVAFTTSIHLVDSLHASYNKQVEQQPRSKT